MGELGMNASAVQAAAKVDNKTLASLLRGERDTSIAVRGRVERALSWPPGEIARRGLGEEGRRRLLDRTSDVELISELLRRAVERDHPVDDEDEPDERPALRVAAQKRRRPARSSAPGEDHRGRRKP